MKIINKNSLSAQEVELLTRLEYEGKEIYTKEDIVSFYIDKKRALYLIKKLLEKKRLRKIIKNIYMLVPIKAPNKQWVVNEYLIAKALARDANYYIGYATVFNSYGFIEQISQMVYIINDKYSTEKSIFGIGFKLVKVLPDRLYGLESRKINKDNVVFQKKERALVDVFVWYDEKKACGILSDQLKIIDVPLFIDYVAKFPVKSVRRKIGYFLEELGVPTKSLSKIVIGEKGFTKLYNRGPNKGKINKKWRIIVNV